MTHSIREQTVRQYNIYDVAHGLTKSVFWVLGVKKVGQHQESLQNYILLINKLTLQKLFELLWA